MSARYLITVISALAGTCFAVLAGLSLSAVIFPVRRFQALSVVIAVAALWLGYLAFRAALAGDVGEGAALRAFHRGVGGALIAVLVMTALLLLFGSATRAFIAHSFGKSTMALPTFRLLLLSALLGFGAGFVLRMPRQRA